MSRSYTAFAEMRSAAFAFPCIVLLACHAQADTVIVDSFDSAPYSFSRNYSGTNTPFLGITVTSESATASDIMGGFPTALHTRSYYHMIDSSSGSNVIQTVAIANGSLNLSGACRSFNSNQSTNNLFRMTYRTSAPADLSDLTSINLSGAVTNAYRISGNPGDFAVRVKLITTTGSKQWVDAYSRIGTALGNMSFSLTDAPYHPYSLSGSLNLAAVTAIEVEFEMGQVFTSGVYSPQFAYRLDEISLTTIPAPSAAPLLALAGLTARGRRRK